MSYTCTDLEENFMVPTVNIAAMPCPDPECREGIILVSNAYNANPLEFEKKICDSCDGRGYIVCESIIEN